MSTTTEAGLSTEKLHQVANLVKRAGEEAVQLRIVERFLSEVERRLLKKSPVVFDIERVRTALQILKTIGDEDDIEECLEAEFRLDQEFHLWRTLIVERDQKIETYHFRRLCDSLTEPLDDEIYVALAAFYKGLDFSPASQSKFDLAVTRLFSKSGAPGVRELRSSRDKMVDRLSKMFEPAEFEPMQSDVEYAVSAIDGFTEEAGHLQSFEDLVRSNIFDRYRVFKRELGSMFFEPEVVAAAIECNIVVGNVFDELLRHADEQLSSRLTVDVDLPAALHDASPEARTHITELFKVFFDDSRQTHSDEFDHLGTLLSASTSRPAQKNEPVQQSAPSSIQDRLAPFLRTLTQAKPDADLLTREMRRSENLASVDINDFLYHKDGTPDVLCRRVLGLILWSLEFRESELRQQKELTEQIQRETSALRFKAESLANSIQTEIEASDEENEVRLRTVLNGLVDSRSRLDRAMARLTNRKNTSERRDVATVQQPPAAAKKSSRARALTRWLFIALFLVSVSTAVLWFLNRQFEGALTSASGFGEVDVHTLPQNELMRSAYRHDHTLFINARDNWKDRSAEDRKSTLQAIMDDPKRSNLQTVVVMGEDGDVIESKSRNVQVSNAKP